MKFVLLFLFFSIASAEIYSAVEDLEALLLNEELLRVEYMNLIKILEKTVNNLKRWDFQCLRNVKFIEFCRKVIKINKEQKAMINDSAGYVSNPLNAFLMIKRLSVDVSRVNVDLSNIASDFEIKTNEIRLSEEEFKGAADGFTRVQMFYDLKVEDLAEGIIEGQKYGDGMTVDDLITLGEYNLENNRTQVSLSYLNLAIQKNRESKDLPEFEILEKIYQIYENSNNSAKMYETIEKMLPLVPEGVNKTMLEEKLWDIPGSGYFEHITRYQRLVDTCKGTVHRNSSELSRFHCRFVSKSAYTKLAPFKVEELNFNPYVAIFYDIMSDDEINIFKMQAKPSLQRSLVQRWWNRSTSVSYVEKIQYL